jgi:4-amino-4-deoxy-L-arabinose transferase-like glycosyltransferase
MGKLFSCTVGLLLLGLVYLFFFHRLADRDLWSSHEARAAQDAETLLLDRHWGLPRLFDRKVELQKPPLYYWLVAATAALRGQPVNAWAVRLPAACSAAGSLILLFLFAWRRGRTLVGLISALVLATALHYTWLARVGRIDMPLAFMIALALVSYYLGTYASRERTGHAWPWFFLSYFAVAAAVLLKGPIGLLLPVAVVAAHLLIDEGGLLLKPRHWPGLAHHYGLWWGLPLVLALTLPWFLWANAQTGGAFFRVFFWKHNFERGFGGGTLTAHPWWLYAPLLAFDFLPWTPLLVGLAGLSWRRGWWREDAEARFGLVWLVAVVVVLSCSRFKRADYLLPAYPGAALFVGSAAERCYRRATRPRLLATGFAGIITGCAIGWWIYLGYVLPRQEASQESGTFAAEIRRRAPVPQLILFFRAEAHALAFHVGRPIDTLLEWENLDVWAGRPEVYFVVMPPEYAEEWPQHLKAGGLKEVLRNTALAGGQHERPLVLLRTHPEAAQPDP